MFNINSFLQIDHLFVGQENGTVSIFKPTSVSLTSTKFLSLDQPPKKLILGITLQPCVCMCLSIDRSCVIIGYGNMLKFIDTKYHLVEDTSIIASATDDEIIQGIAVNYDDIWCFTRGSHAIARYSIESKELLTTIDASLLATPSSKCFTPLCHTSNTIGAILRVKETLWVGRSDGNIFVIDIGRNEPEGNGFGHPLAVLTTSLMSSQSRGCVGAINGLHLLSPDSVVAHTETVDKTDKVILVVWERWCAEDVKNFAHS